MLFTRSALLRSGLASLAVGFLLLAIITLATIWFVQMEQDNRESTRQAVTVEMQLFRLESRLLDAETGQRGYLLTGDDAYLEPYVRSTAAVGGAMDSIRSAIIADAALSGTFNSLQQLVNEKLTELAATIKARREGDMEAALAIVRTGAGKASMDKVRQAIGGIIAAENELVSSRRLEADRAGFRLQLSTLVAAILIAAVAASTLYIFVRQMFVVVTSRDELRAANDKLMREVLHREKIEAQLRQSQKMEALGQLTGGLAHDFNNMLAVILSSLNLLERRHARGEVNLTRFFESAVDAANRAAALIQRLLAFSRKQTLSPEPIDANKFVAGMSDLLHRTIGEPISLETVLAAGLWRTHADANQLESAILNLAVNARDAMPDGGQLTIETANTSISEGYAADVPPGQYVMIAITDSGHGMTAATIEGAFEPFFTTKDVGKGSGLGLSQVYGFVKQSNGHVKIYSEIGHGTTVKIYLPRFVATTGAPDPHIHVTGPPSQPVANGEEVILVVEDEERVRQLTVESLSELGYRVLQAEDAASALRVLDGQLDVTMLFTDIVMPGMNGRRLADEALRRRPMLKVLYTTGYTRNAIIHNGVLDVGVHLVTKPFSLEQLATKVREVLDSPA